MEQKESKKRTFYIISDDDFLFRDIEKDLSNVINFKNRRKFLAMAILSLADKHKKNIEKLPLFMANSCKDNLQRLSLLSSKDDIRETSYYMYATHNAFKSVFNMVLSPAIDEKTIIEHKEQIASQQRFNRYNSELWDKFKSIDEEQIRKVRKIINEMMHSEMRTTNEIKYIGYLGVLERNPSHYIRVAPDEKIIRDIVTGKITDITTDEGEKEQ